MWPNICGHDRELKSRNIIYVYVFNAGEHVLYGICACVCVQSLTMAYMAETKFCGGMNTMRTRCGQLEFCVPNAAIGLVLNLTLSANKKKCSNAFSTENN